MKKIIVIFSLLCVVCQAQFTPKKIEKLNQLDIKTYSLKLEDNQIQQDLNQILTLDKKRKSNKVWAIVFSSVAVASAIAGSVALDKDEPLTYFPGGVLLLGGVVYGGVSVPFWISSHKRKKERDVLIEKLNYLPE